MRPHIQRRTHDPSKLPPDQISAEVAMLHRGEERIDASVRPFLDQVLAHGDAVNAWHMLGKVRTARETQTLTVALVYASSRARQERKKLAAALLRR